MTDAMTCGELEAIIPQLLDDDAEMTTAIQTHLDGCAACRSLVEDLTAIRAEAGALPDLVPPRDLWSGIAARIDSPVAALARPVARVGGSLSWRTAGLAAAALVAVTSAITVGLVRRDASPVVVASEAAAPVTTTTTLPSGPTTSVRGPASAPSLVVPATNMPAGATVAYDREVARLRAILDSGRARLNPATVALLERNLSVIDSAIVQCRDALSKDPASSLLIESLNNAYQTKVKLLRIAATASNG